MVAAVSCLMRVKGLVAPADLVLGPMRREVSTSHARTILQLATPSLASRIESAVQTFEECRLDYARALGVDGGLVVKG